MSSNTWWDVEYSVFKVGGTVSMHFKTKREAVAYARRQARAHGDWVVWRHGPFNRSKKIMAVGGHFDDWPDYDPREDY